MGGGGLSKKVSEKSVRRKRSLAVKEQNIQVSAKTVINPLTYFCGTQEKEENKNIISVGIDEDFFLFFYDIKHVFLDK